MNKTAKSNTYIYVTPFFPSPETWRGAYCFDFVKALKRLRPDLRVEVFVPGKGADYELGGIKVWRFPTRELPSNILPFLFHRHNEKSFLAALARAGVDLRNVKICHGHTANFLIYPLAAKRVNPQIKTLLHHHDLMSFGLNNGRLRHSRLHNIILARGLRRFHEAIDLHVFISGLCKRSFLSFPDIDWLGDKDYSLQAHTVRKLEPVKVKDSYILYNGVDGEIFKPSPSPRRLKYDSLIIGCVGNFQSEKGQYELLQAVQSISAINLETKIKVRFVGSGHDLERCKCFAFENNIDADFLPEMRHEELADFYRSLDLFVLPTWLDGFGCVYTEAFSCGVPFIASETAGASELVLPSERKLWLVKPRDPEDLAAKIGHFIASRPVQHLVGPVSFDALIPPFLEKIGI